MGFAEETSCSGSAASYTRSSVAPPPVKRLSERILKTSATAWNAVYGQVAMVVSVALVRGQSALSTIRSRVSQESLPVCSASGTPVAVSPITRDHSTSQSDFSQGSSLRVFTSVRRISLLAILRPTRLQSAAASTRPTHPWWLSSTGVDHRRISPALPSTRSRPSCSMSDRSPA